jgi:ribonuclease HIII
VTTDTLDALADVPRIGTDEAGKGDYFGDLVVAGVYLDAGDAARASDLGVKDSKCLSDAKVRALAVQIQAAFPTEIVRISPAKYNKLYGKMGNLNRLLAWAHARVIENLLPRTGAGVVISDQFGDAAVLERALLGAGRRVRLVQTPKAERDLAVAAASIVARATFLQRLDALSAEVGVTLPKGATHVLPVGTALYARGGHALLGTVAKLHFATTEQIRQRGTP